MKVSAGSSDLTTAGTCHSLVRPCPYPERLPALLASRAEAGSGRVWTVPTGEESRGPRAAQLRERERRRPLAPGIGLRCVLLEHLDGQELILVADRGMFPYRRLAAIADAAGTPAGRVSSSPAELTPANPAPARPGATGSHREWPLSAPVTPAGSTDPAAVLGALCVSVLRQEPVTVSVEEEDGTTSLRLVTREGASTAGSGFADEPQACVIVTSASPDDYLPVLAPPNPVTAAAFRAADGSVRLRVFTADDKVDPAAGEVIATHLVRRLATGSPHFELDEAEAARILRAGRGPDQSADVPGGIPDAIRAVAHAHAGRVAVTGDGTELTYGELDEMSGAAAGALLASGVRPGQRVGVCMERTPRAVVAMLAVLRAGACYVPLEPTHPFARRAYVTADAGLRLVLTDSVTAEQPPGVPAVTLDDMLHGTEGRTLPDVQPDHPAYVIYTSGTTGEPKGTVIPHRNVLALIAAGRTEFGLTTSDTWTAFHSFAFDFSVWEIWGCLLTGGRLVVVPHWTARSPAKFARLLDDHRVTVLSQTPSAFANLMPAVLTAAPADGPALDLRLVVFGGEALRAPTLAPWLRRFPATTCRLVNMYGITETTVHVTSHDVAATDGHSVGTALPGWSVSVRDPQGRLLPFGVAGEICVGGAGLALGYLGRPALTEERFPVDPATGTRYYRSGDVGVLHPDGTLDHLGRLDSQVKIRGHRVELGEIRAALLKDPAVRDAVLDFQETAEGGAIVAYVVLAHAVPATVLRRGLTGELPDYMIPATIRTVDAVPLTPNGKADTAALASLARPDEPRTPANEPKATGDADSAAMVNRLWVGMFGPESVEENFFDLGGTSLQALKLATDLQDLGLGDVDPQEVYLNPTVKELTLFLNAAG
jgi:amino acid adenylation domain-containing protein